jgi:hypothetical protein
LALFVLGAGATRGCSFVNENKEPCVPPLDADFFTQLQRVRNPKHQKLIDNVMADVVDLFGSNFSVTLETVFTTLEHTTRMLKTTGDNRAFNRVELEERQDRLRQAIAAVLEESLTLTTSGENSSRQPNSCSLHQELVRKALKNKDDIISFNYDCVIDDALKKSGAKKWNARYGYGFELGPRGKKLKGDAFWNPDDPANEGNTTHLYKLHGSLHFQVKGKYRDEIKLKQRPYTAQKGNLQFDIIPPEWNKDYDRGIFARLWKRAATAIKQAEHIVMIGYSLPATDLHSNALFRTCMVSGRLKSLTIVNPDKDARGRIRSVLQRGISSKSRVLSLGYMAEFLALDPSVWRK